eukprot:2354291-Amphidinium_carterae.1
MQNWCHGAIHKAKATACFIVTHPQKNHRISTRHQAHKPAHSTVTNGLSCTAIVSKFEGQATIDLLHSNLKNPRQSISKAVHTKHAILKEERDPKDPTLTERSLLYRLKLGLARFVSPLGGRKCVRKADVLVRYAIVVASALDDTVVWRCSEAGLETTTTKEGYRVLLQLKPHLFINPMNREPFTTTGQEQELLRGDRVPAGASELKMFYRMLQGIMSTPAGLAEVATLQCPWPDPTAVSRELLASTMQAFLEVAAPPGTTSAVGMADAAEALIAIQQRDLVALQVVLDRCAQAWRYTLPNDSSEAHLAERFRAFLRLETLPAPTPHNVGVGAPSASSNDIHAEAEIDRNTSAIEAFALASQSMGGRALGPWRAFRIDQRQHYGTRHGQTYWKPHGWVKRR